MSAQFKQFPAFIKETKKSICTPFIAASDSEEAKKGLDPGPWEAGSCHVPLKANVVIVGTFYVELSSNELLISPENCFLYHLETFAQK